jgi:hypothetical protein
MFWHHQCQAGSCRCVKQHSTRQRDGGARRGAGAARIGAAALSIGIGVWRHIALAGISGSVSSAAQRSAKAA